MVAVVRSILLLVAAVSVIGTSNYLAYLIGRKQASYEEFRRQVDRVVQLMDQKQVEEESAPTLKQQQDRLEQYASGLTDLTTSTINGKTTVVAPEQRASKARSLQHRSMPHPSHRRTGRCACSRPKHHRMLRQSNTMRLASPINAAHADRRRQGGLRPKLPGRRPVNSTTSIPATARDASVAGQ